MKIISAKPCNYISVRTDEEDWSEYQRHGPDCWYQLMGMSWEEVTSDEIEKAYQELVLDLAA